MQVLKNEFLSGALEKLKKEAGQISGQKEKAMAPAVRNAMEDFCRQEPEFAQAVVQGGSFRDCMAAVAKGVGVSISDSEAFAKAARFYFPGSRVRVVMEIDLVGDARDEEEQIATAPAELCNDKAGSGPQLVGREAPKKVAVQLQELKQAQKNPAVSEDLLAQLKAEAEEATEKSHEAENCELDKERREKFHD